MASLRDLLGRLGGKGRAAGPGDGKDGTDGKVGTTSKAARKALGEGVWLRLVTRSERALDRYHQVLEKAPEGDTRDALIVAGNTLFDVHEALFAVCLEGQRLAPSDGFNVPAGQGGQGLVLHRRASALPTFMAQAAEAALLTANALGRGDQSDAETSLHAVQRTVERIEEGLVEAQAAVTE